MIGPNGEDLDADSPVSVGYAQTLPNVLRLVGLPTDDETITLFSQNPPQPALVLASQAFVYLNQTELTAISETCIGF